MEKTIRLLFDASEICTQLNGTAQYTINLINLFNKYYYKEFFLYIILNPDLNELEFLSHFDKLRLEYEIIPLHTRPIGPMRDLKYLKINRYMKDKYDLYICPTEKWPYFMKEGIFIVHDARAVNKTLIGLNILKKIYLKFILKKGFKNSTSIISVSGSTLKDFEESMRINLSDKSSVVYSSRPEPVLVDSTKISDDIKYFDSEDYFLFFGQLWRLHKNVQRLIDAFKEYKKECNTNMKLVLAGDDKNTLNHQDLQRYDIFYLGYIEEADRQYLLKNAKVLVNISVFEGFSFPILEALQNDVEVICSDLPVFKELYRCMVSYVDPYSVDAIVNVFKDFTDSPEVKSKDNLEQFKEEVSAAGIYNVIKRAAKN